jgi:hypothetical protein
VFKKLEFLIQFDKSRLRILFYMIWDIEECLEVSNYDWEYWVFKKGVYQYTQDWERGLNINKNEYRLILNNCKYNQIRDFNLKKENKFYDLDHNINFFTNVFKYFIITATFQEHELATFFFPYDTTFNDLKHSYLTSVEKEGEYYFINSEALEVYNKETISIRSNSNLTSVRINKYKLDSEIDEKIKDEAYFFLKEIRKEWESNKEGTLMLKQEVSNLETIVSKFLK